jgi:hypothetical protein
MQMWRFSWIKTMVFILLSVCLLGKSVSAEEQKQNTRPNYGQIRTVNFEKLEREFSQPDMIYAPFMFWFWDEPVDTDNYFVKPANMAREMLKKGINPGYAHPRVSMADYVGPKAMTPSPSLPKKQWLSPEWFNAFGGALEEAEAANGYFGYCDEYMWPSGRATGRVMQKHPELGNANLEWKVVDVKGGTAIDLPASFFTIAAQLDHEPNLGQFSVPVITDTVKPVDLTGVDLCGNKSLGQTVVVEYRALKEVMIQAAIWKDTPDINFMIEVRRDGPDGKLISSKRVEGDIKKGEMFSVPIAEDLAIGSTLYVAVIPASDFPKQEVGWWSKSDDVYAGGTAFLNGQAVAGDRYLKLFYLTQPGLMVGNWIWQPEVVADKHTVFFRKAFELGLGQKVAKAKIQVTADNRYKLYINDTFIGEDTNWSNVETYDVTKAMKPGRNIIAIEGGGEGGLDALLCDMKIDLTNAQQVQISSDASWIVSRHIKDGWTKPDYNDSGWSRVRIVGPADSEIWNLKETKSPYIQATIRSSTLQLIGSGDAFSWTAPSTGYWRVYKFKKITGGDVNLLDKRLAAAFIDIAHKPYAEHFGARAGTSIPGAFCDTEGSYGNNLPWSESLSPCYLANTGRDIRLYMPLMLDKDVEGVSARARFDWFKAVSDLYAGFFNDVSGWLAQRGMYFTGHVWEENLLWQACTVGDHMNVQRAFSMPGMDCLFKSGYDVHDFKEVQSVSEFESRRMMAEMMGAAGWNDFNPITVKEITNCVINWGVNHVMPHGIFMSRGLDGNPWLPDWYDENPMWSNMHLWSDFVRRASYVNSQGHVAPDVLLLNPMDSVWTQMDYEVLWGPNGSGNLTNLGSQPDSMAKHIETVYSDAIRKLAVYRVEYLIGDRHYINQMSVDGARLVRGDFRFKTVVLPPMVVLPLSVARKIVDFAKAGGYVYTLGELPTGSTDNGLNDPLMSALMSQLQAQSTVKACTQGLSQELSAKSPGLTSPIQFTSGQFPMLQLRRRIDNREFFWLVNNSDQARQCVVQVADAAGAASVWDCETGTVRPVASTQNGSGSQLQLAFQPHEAYWLVFDPQAPAKSTPIMALPNETTILSIEGTWTVRIDPAVQPNLEHAVTIPAGWTGAGVSHALTLWETWAEMPAKFSGLLDYTKTVTLPAFTGELVVDLGQVNHVAEVWVNGQHVGAKLWPPHKFQTNAFHAGSNEIRIRVGNLVNNNYNMASPSGLAGPVVIKTITN